MSSYDKTVLPDGTIVFDIVTSQIKQTMLLYRDLVFMV